MKNKRYKKGYHVSSPSFREAILSAGLLPKIGPSYLSHYEDKNMGPAVFFSVDRNNLFDSTYDDDVWEITIPDGMCVFEDPKMKHPMMFTFSAIGAECLKLIYRGSGESSW
jgi:hypothetical protein